MSHSTHPGRTLAVSSPTRGDVSLRSALRTGSGALGLAAAGLAGLVAGCNSASSPEANTANAGEYVDVAGETPFFVDPNFAGEATSIRIRSQYFGRLVTIASRRASGIVEPVLRDFVVDPRSESQWPEADYELQTNNITGEQTLVIEADEDGDIPDPVTGETGRERFLRLLRAADGGRAISDEGFVGAANYTLVPRNAAVVFVFDDLLDADSVSAQSVRIVEGNPPSEPFRARVFVDPNHGARLNFDGVGGPEFYSTRLIVDPTISSLEASTIDPVPQVNNRGFPESLDLNIANVQVRFQTQSFLGQALPPLQNLTEHFLTTSNNGTFDFGVPTRDVVRAFRTGNRDDPFNGYLPDETPPSFVSSQATVILGGSANPTDDIDWLLDNGLATTFSNPLTYEIGQVRFSSTFCAVAPKIGDVIVVATATARVIPNPMGSSFAGNTASNLWVELIDAPETIRLNPELFQTAGIGPAQLLTEFVPNQSAPPECFVTVLPAPQGGINNPATGIPTSASFSIRFNEAIDPGPVEPYESLVLSRKAVPTVPTDYIVGALTNDGPLRTFTFRPETPLTHVLGQQEEYFLSFAFGERGFRDLAGNAIALEDLPRAPVNGANPNGALTFTIAPTEPPQEFGGRAIRFEQVDAEFPRADPSAADRIDRVAKPEFAGTATIDTVSGRLRPRALVRFQNTINQGALRPLTENMTIGPETSLPLAPLGARTQFIWRYRELGLNIHADNNITNPVTVNEMDLDVESIYLSPFGVNPVFESYPEFEIALAHTPVVPDEVVTPTNQLIDPNSGLFGNFADNLLDLAADPLEIVSPRLRGYTIEPGNQILAPDGTRLISLGLNDGLPPSQRLTYTYRDTTLRARGGTAAAGVPIAREFQVTSVGPQFNAFFPDGSEDCENPGAPNPIYPSGQVRTAGLSLLVDVKCFSNGGISSQNVFANAIAHAPSFQPYFRAFSAGGQDQSGTLVRIDPDDETTALGGFDPTSVPPGLGTQPRDNVVYFGAVDFVTRVSRSYSIFFPAFDPTGGPDLTPDDIAGDLRFNTPAWDDATLFPETQPEGTRVEIRYRAVSNFGAPNEDLATTTAGFMDPYGDFYATIPIDYTPGLGQDDPDPAFSTRGNASCFDASFSYPVGAENDGIAFIGGDRWTSDVNDLLGAQWVQLQISFFSNLETGQTPSLAALGLTWRETL